MKKVAGWRRQCISSLKLTGLIAAGVLVASCGDSGPTQTNNDADEAVRIESKGRLAITEVNEPGVHVIDLDDGAMLAKVATDFPPSALYASPSRRYALAIQRSQDLVQFVDGGLWQEDHVEHLHDYEQAPSLTDTRLAGVRPTHYEVAEGKAALFMDGNADTGETAAVVILDDDDIEKGALETTLALPMQMHGTAEPRGNYLLSTWRAPSDTSTLPEQVELYRQDGASFEFLERFELNCPSLHGSYSNEDHSVFGCADGVLVVSQVGDAFSATKINNPPDMPEDLRIGTLLGSHDLPVFIGLAGTSGVYEINPQAGTMTPIEWVPDRLRIAQAFDHEAHHFLLLDDLGMLHVFDAKAGWAIKGALQVSSAVVPDGPRPSLEAHPSEDLAYVSDPEAKQITVVNTEALAVSEQIPVSFIPANVRWLGISGSHDHDHE